jgi:hypothetical protein
VGAGPVAAAFFNFHPAMVAAAVPASWDAVDPAVLTVQRSGAAAAALSELCSPAALGRAVGALPSLRIASAMGAVSTPGRVLAAANRALGPVVAQGLRDEGVDEELVAVAEVWQAATTLREHRGDGHVAALVADGLGGCEAHVLAAAVLGVPDGVLRDNRGWSEAEWSSARAGLMGRGLVSGDGDGGTATPEGRARHAGIEALTDELAEPAYGALDDDALSAVYDALVPCAREIQDSGVLPFPNPMGLPHF